MNDDKDAGAEATFVDWRCRLCGHWIQVPTQSSPLAMLQQIAGRARECVVHVDGLTVHRCNI
jgi:hypothetical protein